MNAIYSTAMDLSFVCRIPKKRDIGYLKSCFGWHSSNKPSTEWDRIRPSITTGEYCDLDGHLDIQLRLYWWEEGFKDGIEQLKASLSRVFPHVNVWQEVSLGEALGAPEPTQTALDGSVSR